MHSLLNENFVQYIKTTLEKGKVPSRNSQIFPNKQIFKRDKIKTHMKTNSHHTTSIAIAQFRTILQKKRKNVLPNDVKKKREKKGREKHVINAIARSSIHLTM